MSKLIEMIEKAIRDQKVISFKYGDKKRIVEPHCLGETHKGKTVLRAYQVDGESGSTKIPGWALFEIAKIERARRTKKDFSVRLQEGYKATDKSMANIHTAVSDSASATTASLSKTRSPDAVS